MSYQHSMLYTIGVALSRSLDDNAEIELLVDGQWLRGCVVAYDGHGVVLDNNDDHAIVKVERVSAVRVLSAVPGRERITDGHLQVAEFSEPMPMPAPPVDGAA